MTMVIWRVVHLGTVPSVLSQLDRDAVSRQQIISCRNVPPVNSVALHRSSNVAVAASTKEKKRRERADDANGGHIQRALSSCFGNKSDTLIRHLEKGVLSSAVSLFQRFLCRRQAIIHPVNCRTHQLRPQSDLCYYPNSVCHSCGYPAPLARRGQQPTEASVTSQALPSASWQFPIFFVPLSLCSSEKKDAGPSSYAVRLSKLSQPSCSGPPPICTQCNGDTTLPNQRTKFLGTCFLIPSTTSCPPSATNL